MGFEYIAKLSVVKTQAKLRECCSIISFVMSIRIFRLRPRPKPQSTRREAMNYRRSRWLSGD
jgi:hypothetical protein